jgi:hypothetical protein
MGERKERRSSSGTCLEKMNAAHFLHDQYWQAEKSTKDIFAVFERLQNISKKKKGTEGVLVKEFTTS